MNGYLMKMLQYYTILLHVDNFQTILLTSILLRIFTPLIINFQMFVFCLICFGSNPKNSTFLKHVSQGLTQITNN